MALCWWCNCSSNSGLYSNPSRKEQWKSGQISCNKPARDYRANIPWWCPVGMSPPRQEALLLGLLCGHCYGKIYTDTPNPAVTLEGLGLPTGISPETLHISVAEVDMESRFSVNLWASLHINVNFEHLSSCWQWGALLCFTLQKSPHLFLTWFLSSFIFCFLVLIHAEVHRAMEEKQG